MTPFIGRAYELNLLYGLTKKNAASLVVLKGTWRTGKSRLAEAFASSYQYYAFSGLPPQHTSTEASEREAFFAQLGHYFDTKKLKSKSWWDMLWFLADQTTEGRIVILFDEISWTAARDPDFLGILKTIWDTCFKKNPKLILILCGSVSIWIQKNIVASTGFVGRISLQLTLRELPIQTCHAFLGKRAEQFSPYETFKFLSVCGGIPRYLEEWQSHLSIDENINRMCFHENGILYNEFDQIFYDSITSEADVYRSIVLTLANRSQSRSELLASLNRTPGGKISEYLKNLITSGFVTQDYTWHLKSKKLSKLSRYRLSDNYLRFYLRYIEPQKEMIKSHQYKMTSLSGLPSWPGMIALQFENLVLNNRESIYSMLGIRRDDIEIDGAFFQKPTTKNSGCQIDHLIQTKTSVLYACEIKFSRHFIKSDIISEMQDKLKRLVLPRGFSCMPVLIHVNGVCDDVMDA